MRILLALDGSPSSTWARDLVANTRWPGETTIRVIAVAIPAEDLLDAYLGPTGGPGASSWDDAPPLSRVLDEAEARLAAPDRQVQRALVRGRPASEILDAAADFGADLVVLGSHGHGTLERLLLGSVSAEVVDHALCPVLVARRGDVRAILLAVDGSFGAAQATGFLIRTGAFQDASVTALGVCPGSVAGSIGLVAGHVETSGLYAEAVELSRRRYAEIACGAADQLRREGYTATGIAASGDPASVILGTARSRDTDLIVVGTHGRTGLLRILVGSVARKVLLHADVSVLVVPDRARAGGPLPGELGDMLSREAVAAE